MYSNAPIPRPLVLIVLDGWGISFIEKGNAIMAAKTPNTDMFYRQFPVASVVAAGIEVGLPWGEKGNSETGHRNIGAGQVQYQPLPRIDKSIEDRSFFDNPALLQAIDHVKKNNSRLHIMGLASTGGIHAHINHIYALLELAKEKRLSQEVYIHMFTDGRDTPPQSALGDLEQLERMIGKYGIGKIASVTGRFYAMDRNENWERTKQTYDMLTGGPRTSGAPSAREAIEMSYRQNVFDEMIPPTSITRGGGPIATIQDNDAIIFSNYRPDRARQITCAFAQENFQSFPRRKLNNFLFVGMEEYDHLVPIAAAFVNEQVKTPLAKVISDAGINQLHMAETEKYAHVTYYLNGGREEPFPLEDHVMIKSSGVKNFASEPHMGAEAITDRLIEEINKNVYGFCVINLANADMVGHTGNFDATVEACSFVDVCLGRIYEAIRPIGGAMLVTADHGNAEEKLSPYTGEVETDHTSNPVALNYIYEPLRHTVPRTDAELVNIFSSPIGMLADVAPTVLDILHLEKPDDMSGISLLNSLQ